MTEQIVIDSSNFNQYFFDVRNHQPARGQVMARYAAMAEFIDGDLKRDMIDMLCLHEQTEPVVKLMRKLGCATESDSVTVPLYMARDLLSGMSPEEVAKKPYRFVCEAFFYTKKEYIPLDDPHWSVISLHNLDEFLDAKDQRCKLKGRVLSDEEKPKDMSKYEHHVRAGSDFSAEGVDNPQADTGTVLNSERNST